MRLESARCTASATASVARRPPPPSVGWPCATSSAKRGPGEHGQAAGRAASAAATSRHALQGVESRGPWWRTPAPRPGAAAPASAAVDAAAELATGSTTSTVSAPATAAREVGGRPRGPRAAATPGQVARVLAALADLPRERRRRAAQSRTSWPARARWAARAVPQEPPPSTATVTRARAPAPTRLSVPARAAAGSRGASRRSATASRRGRAHRRPGAPRRNAAAARASGARDRAERHVAREPRARAANVDERRRRWRSGRQGQERAGAGGHALAAAEAEPDRVHVAEHGAPPRPARAAGRAGASAQREPRRSGALRGSRARRRASARRLARAAHHVGGPDVAAAHRAHVPRRSRRATR